jgi:PAS domain-containing protein
VSTNSVACATGGLTVEDVLETLGDAFCAVDRGLILVAANQKARTLLNVTRPALGLALTTVLPVPVRADLERALVEVAADSHSLRLEMTWPPREIPLRVDVHAAGPCLHIYFRDAAGFRDMKNELRTRHEILTLAEECAGIGVWDVDLKTLMLEGTEQFFRIMGLAPSPVPISIDVTRRLRFSDEQEKVMRGFQQALESGTDVFDSE